MAKKILYFEKVLPENREILEANIPEGYEMAYMEELNEAEQAKALAEGEFMMLIFKKATEDVIRSVPKLRHVQRTGIGFETVDIKTCNELGITVSNLPLGNATAVAEHAAMLPLVIYRHVLSIDRRMRNGEWPAMDYRTNSYEMDGKVHGFIGMGNIARLTAERSRPFGTKLIYYDIVRRPKEEEERLGLTYVDSMDEVLKQADIVSIHLHLNDETRGIIGKREIGLMKKGAILVNISRGGLVDEQALYEAIKSGHLFGAGIDTWATEPNIKDNPLMTLENVVCTCHSAAGTIDTFKKQILACFENIVKADKEGTPNYVVGEVKTTKK